MPILASGLYNWQVFTGVLTSHPCSVYSGTLWLLIFLDHMFYAGETVTTSPHPRADLAEALLPP